MLDEIPYLPSLKFYFNDEEEMTLFVIEIIKKFPNLVKLPFTTDNIKNTAFMTRLLKELKE